MKPSLDHYTVGQRVQAVEVSLRTGTTRPPPYYTVASLVDAMTEVDRLVTDPADRKVLRDAKGIGTARTRDECVKKLETMAYCYQDGKGRGKKLPPFRPTPRGRALCSLLGQLPLANPVMTAKWELALRQIESGKASYQHFMTYQRQFVRAMVDNMLTLNIPAGLLGEQRKSREPAEEVEPLDGDGSPCPECKRGVLKTRKVTKVGSPAFGKRFLSCSNWKGGCKHTEWEGAATRTRAA